MSSAIVRNCIANSTIDEVLKSRDLMRDQIKKKLTPIVTGWGVYLETVEIIDVKISSGSLFTNMQCKFREDQNREATVQKNGGRPHHPTRKGETRFNNLQAWQWHFEGKEFGYIKLKDCC